MGEVDTQACMRDPTNVPQCQEIVRTGKLQSLPGSLPLLAPSSLNAREVTLWIPDIKKPV